MASTRGEEDPLAGFQTPLDSLRKLEGNSEEDIDLDQIQISFEGLGLGDSEGAGDSRSS